MGNSNSISRTIGLERGSKLGSIDVAKLWDAYDEQHTGKLERKQAMRFLKVVLYQVSAPLLASFAFLHALSRSFRVSFFRSSFSHSNVASLIPWSFLLSFLKTC